MTIQPINIVSPTEKILGRKLGRVGHLIFNNPEQRNAVGPDMWRAIPAVLNALQADADVRVVVVSGAGNKSFISGGNIKEFDNHKASRVQAETEEPLSEIVRERLRTFPKPVIAMIRGYCLGGGVGVALACDLRIASDNAQFGVPAGRLGNGYGEAGLGPIVNVVGPAVTKEILFTARRYSAHEALSLGLVNRVVPDAELESFVTDYAETIAENAPMTLVAVKRVVNELVKNESQRDMKAARDLVMRCFDSNDYREGRAAFREKRKPIFTGS